MFAFDDTAQQASPALVAEVRPGIQNKADLLAALAESLRFPEYFGGNWDALQECIRDLSWLPAGSVVLKHHDLPLDADPSGVKTYLSILKDAVDRWSGTSDRSLTVTFPPETRDAVLWVLRRADRDA